MSSKKSTKIVAIVETMIKNGAICGHLAYMIVNSSCDEMINNPTWEYSSSENLRSFSEIKVQSLNFRNQNARQSLEQECMKDWESKIKEAMNNQQMEASDQSFIGFKGKKPCEMIQHLKKTFSL